MSQVKSASPSPAEIADVAAAEAYLRGLVRAGIKYGLENFTGLLRALDAPERSRPWIHVAGTNGKGSTSAMAESILRTAGLPTVMFSSPHLVSQRERFRVDGRPASDEAFLEAVRALSVGADRAVSAGHETPTFFEGCSALTFLLARAHAGAWGVLECGLGGRLDATNLATPEVGVVTSIGLDHTKTLGPELTDIAREKAGIAKTDVPLLVSPSISGETFAALEAEAKARGGLIEQGLCEVTNVAVDPALGFTRMHLTTPTRDYGELKVGLLGAHQAANAALAVRACELALERRGLGLGPEAVVEGLARVRWPGRFDVRNVEGTPVILDAMHNPQGLRAFLPLWRQVYPDARPVLLYGACSDKAVGEMLPALADICSEVVFAQAPVVRAAPAQSLADHWHRLVLKPTARVSESVADAWDHALARARELNQPLLVCGSLYLLGNIYGLEQAPGVEG